MNLCTGISSRRHLEVAFVGIDCPVCEALARVEELEEARVRDGRISREAPDAVVQLPDPIAFVLEAFKRPLMGRIND